MEEVLVATASAPPGNADTGHDVVQTWARLTVAWLMSFSSEHTRAAYQSDIRRWTGWCIEHGVQPLAVTRAHVDAYARSLEMEALKPATIGRKLASLSSIYGYAEDERLIDRNPVARVKRPKVPTMSDTRWLTQTEMKAFIAAAEQSGPKDHLIALLLTLSGLRSGELRSLRIEEIGAYGEFTTILIHGKGGHDERAPVPQVTADVLDVWVGERRYGFVIDGGPWRGWKWDDPSTQLAVPDDDTSEIDMSPWQLERVVTRLANQAGINSTTPAVTPHSLRHSAITAALDAGVDMRDVEVLARHADPRTTRRYDRTRQNFNRHASLVLARTLLG